MTDTEQLEAFFARAADVLADWHPSEDAMVARMCDSREFEVYSDSGYAEFWLPSKPADPAPALMSWTAVRAGIALLARALSRH